MTVVSPSDLKSLEASLLNKSGDVPLHTRFRALFTLKALKSENAVDIISDGSRQLLQLDVKQANFDQFHEGFRDSSALLKHELAYCLGQMKMTSALPALEKTLRDKSEDPMVRHEVSLDYSNIVAMNPGSG